MQLTIAAIIGSLALLGAGIALVLKGDTTTGFALLGAGAGELGIKGAVVGGLLNGPLGSSPKA